MPIRYLRRSGKRLYGTNGKRRNRRRTTRTYRNQNRRRRSYGRKMTKRQLLNATSTKKRDKMRQVTVVNYGGTAAPGVLTLAVQNPANDVTNSRVNFLPWIATARVPITSNRDNEADRTATQCYMRGLSETLRLSSLSPDQWEWRRICFTLRGPAISSFQTLYYYTGAGFYRLSYNASNDASGQNAAAVQQAVYDKLFKGTYQSDWDDPMLAQVDNTRVDIKYDKIKMLKSGNSNPHERVTKLWMPMNKNLYYDDDQAGAGTNFNPLSVNDKRGMGDYYVIDLFRCTNISNTGTPAPGLAITYSSELYWYEK